MGIGEAVKDPYDVDLEFKEQQILAPAASV